MGILEMFKRPRAVTQTVIVTGDSVSSLSASQLYDTQPALRSVISFLADNVAGLPLKCYVRMPDGGRERDRDSALAKLLQSPNGWSTGHELIRATVSEYLLHDDALWLTIPANTESGWMAAVVPHNWVSPKTSDGLAVDYVRIKTPYSQEFDLQSGDYLRFVGWSPYGSAHTSGKIEALKAILSEQISAWNFRNGVWKNGGRVTQWISRPADVPWGEGARDRFVKSWKSRFSGDDGTDTGGTPLLEDGMRLEQTQFNAREAQWVEATRLSREDVCAVYHVNPGLIYHTDAQTYASAKDNARALYSDTLAPLLDMLEERINAFLVPRLGLDSSHYCEFDLSAKLQGSFEEQAAVISSAVGGPWMTRDEARERFNLPKIEGQGSDELIVPLNVVTGGQASPRDVDGTPSAYAALPAAKSAGYRTKSAPEDADAEEITATLRKFFRRQARSIVPKLDKGAKADDFPSWWNAERWERELADDLAPIFMRQAVRRGRRTVDEAGLGGEFDAGRIENYIAAMAKGKSKAINDVTYRELREALDGDFDEGAMGATVEGVYEKAEGQRSETAGRSFATAVAGFAIVEACEQRAQGREVVKTWVVTSANPRPEHAAMDGETVPYADEFSNGAKFPGDQVLTPEESCNCQCQVEIYVP